MKNLILVLLLITAFACATKPKSNTASFSETSSEVNKKLKDIPPLTAQDEFEGYKVAAKECSSLRTMYLELSPAPTGNFETSLKRRIEPKTIMAMMAKKKANQQNPCSRLRLYTSMKDIRELGSKKRFDEKGVLAKGTLGYSSSGQTYLELTFYEKLKSNLPEKMAYPGHFLAYEKASEMTDDELAEWIVATMYHVGWK